MLIFFWESAHCIPNWFEVSKFLYTYTCPFPKNIKHPKIFTFAVSIVKFENSKTAFRNFENSKSDLPNFGIFEKLEEDK